MAGGFELDSVCTLHDLQIKGLHIGSVTHVEGFSSGRTSYNDYFGFPLHTLHITKPVKVYNWSSYHFWTLSRLIEFSESHLGKTQMFLYFAFDQSDKS